MTICLIAEGSYPYVSGGVSSWIQMLVESMPEHDFIVFAIGAEEKDKGKFRYVLPKNVSAVHECFLDTSLKLAGHPGRRYVMERSHREALSALITGKECSWNDIFSMVDANPRMQAVDFIMSREFYEIVALAAEMEYPYISFNEYFWCIRAMLLPLLGLLCGTMPQADIYHAVSTGYAGVLAARGATLCQAACILTEHGIYTREREEEIIKAEWVKGYFKNTWIDYFISLSLCAYRQANPVISLFGAARDIQHQLGCNPGKTRVVPNGVQSEDFRNLPLKEKEEGVLWLGALVRLVPIKDIKTMIQAFFIAQRTVPGMRLHIMGPSEEDPAYSEACRQLAGGPENPDIVFTGQVPVREWVGSMDILLLSSISEGQPLAVLEGMAASKPHVLTDVGSCRELMNGMPRQPEDTFGPAGIVVPVMNPAAYAAAIVLLAQSPEMRRQMGQSACARVGGLYTMEALKATYREIYRKGGLDHGRDRF